jgi:hypothetical protein
MEIVKGTRLRHPKKSEWGLGEVVAVEGNNVISVIFENIGLKRMSLDFFNPVIDTGMSEKSSVLDNVLAEQNTPKKYPSGKPLCNNCGHPTQFGDQADRKRVDLGWCNPCFKQSQRTFEDKETGKVRYYDELRTVDGIKTRYSPK